LIPASEREMLPVAKSDKDKFCINNIREWKCELQRGEYRVIKRKNAAVSNNNNNNNNIISSYNTLEFLTSTHRRTFTTICKEHISASVVVVKNFGETASLACVRTSCSELRLSNDFRAQCSAFEQKTLWEVWAVVVL